MAGGRDKKRRLSPEDAALWSRVAETATPLKKRDMRPEASAKTTRAAPVQPPKPKVRPTPPMDRAEAPAKPARPLPRITLDLASRGVAPASRGPISGIDRRTSERIRKGAKTPDARIDLHGMTADRAHGALTRFVMQGVANGARLLLVITGKGGDKTIRTPGHYAGEDAAFMPRREGVLKREVPRWLREPPIAGHVVGVFQAHPRHGGEGALYVYLKRVR